MLIFNCTKTAADHFSVVTKGKKESCLKTAPHKTIEESILYPVFPHEVNPRINDGFQWQWMVDCVSVKKKKYMLVMDYTSRYCLIFPAEAKGDELAFLNAFENQLKANFRYWANKHQITVEQGTDYIQGYDMQCQASLFHQRGDRSVQAHLKEVKWNLEAVCASEGVITKPLECVYFSVTTSGIPRTCKGEKNYFIAHERFFSFWLANFNLDAILESCDGEIALH